MLLAQSVFGRWIFSAWHLEKQVQRVFLCEPEQSPKLWGAACGSLLSLHHLRSMLEDSCPLVSPCSITVLTELISGKLLRASTGLCVSAHEVQGPQASQPLFSGLPSQKPKEQQRSVLRPAVLQAPQPKALSQTGKKQPWHPAATAGCRASVK